MARSLFNLPREQRYLIPDYGIPDYGQYRQLGEEKKRKRCNPPSWALSGHSKIDGSREGPVINGVFNAFEFQKRAAEIV
jgi:hypothetical protein